jgi:hypothetical protein
VWCRDFPKWYTCPEMQGQVRSRKSAKNTPCITYGVSYIVRSLGARILKRKKESRAGCSVREDLKRKREKSTYGCKSLVATLFPLGDHPPVRLTSRHSAPYLIYPQSIP